MIDLYYWQHGDRRLAASMPWWADMAGRNQAEGRNLFGWNPPDEARSVVGTGRASCVALCGAALSQTSGHLRRPAWTP